MRLFQDREYCMGTTNLAMEIAKSDDKYLANPTVTGDCWVCWQIWQWLGMGVGDFCGDWELVLATFAVTSSGCQQFSQWLGLMPGVLRAHGASSLWKLGALFNRWCVPWSEHFFQLSREHYGYHRDILSYIIYSIYLIQEYMEIVVCFYREAVDWIFIWLQGMHFE